MSWKQGGALLFFLATLLILPNVVSSQWAFGAAAVSLAGAIVAIGVGVKGRLLGALISDRNLMSLSRFQATLWTILVLAAFAAILFPQLLQGKPVADLIKTLATRTDLLALMGISYASAVGSGLVLTGKEAKNPTPQAIAEAKVNTEMPDAERKGVLFKNPEPQKAAFTDMFEGDELADTHLVDIAKVQMFFFTVIGAVIFIAQASVSGLTSIPLMPDSLIALMGISHAAYLGNKTVTRTPEAGPQPQPAPGVSAPPPQPQPQPQPSVVTGAAIPATSPVVPQNQ